MESITRFLESKLKLKVNRGKSGHMKPQLKVAPESVKRLKEKVKELFRQGRRWSLKRTVDELTPILRGWGNYFRFAQVKNVFEELDGWIRRRLRCIIRHQWKRSSQPDETRTDGGSPPATDEAPGGMQEPHI
jgi:RNA-directed DNA polymerase